ncbi:MAG: hypothetical protein BZY88_07350 [SAR202 cluster bacterium Io17-Chloro-G9]|nr:MAG: hypothetical protein BZY88_07350 [SAR202 cluster bacterium Io17-Chloro-G9]
MSDSTNGADYGALFCTFNEDGVENRANCYFKNISGRIVDEFNLEVLLEDGGPRYEGFWEPASGDFSGEFAELRRLGVNTMSFGPSYTPQPDGTYTIRPGGKEFVVGQIVEAHENGIEVYLVPTFWNPFARPDAGQDETYLENFTPIVLEWAEIAQQYGVALFSPVNEPDMVFPSETVGEWLHYIIPEINDCYGGMTVTKFAHLADMDFSGYDYVGFDLIGSTTAESVRDQVALANQYAERDGARGVFIAEFGVPAEDTGTGGVRAVGDEMQAEIIDRVFRESRGEVDGYFVISWLLPEYSIKGRPAEQVVEQGFAAVDGNLP